MKVTALLGLCVMVWALFLVASGRTAMAVAFLVTGLVVLVAWVLFQVRRWRRAMTRRVPPPELGGERTIEALDPIEGGCRYTIAQQVDVRPGCRVSRTGATHWRSGARERLERTHEVLASGGSAADVPPT